MLTDALKNKAILVGVTGGIAAYKTPDLIRRLRACGAIVRVVMTQAAKAFITSLTLQAVSGNPVHDDLFDATSEAAMGHIELARWADLVLIAPTSANFIAKLTHGFADDLLSTLCLATASPIILVPAMNQQMWANLATQANVQCLQARAITFLGPADGAQACGDFGNGRMLEPVEIVQSLLKLARNNLLTNIRILITAGPTQEPIDPVRYISNHSSGKMGYAIASAAAQQNAQVTLISGPVTLTTPSKVKRINVTTAQEMHQTVLTAAPTTDIFIAVAAVADYRCKTPTDHKIKKNMTELILTLERNPDILAEVAQLPSPPFTVGFAAETDNLLIYAQNKLENKKIDMIAANYVGKDIGFAVDQNALTVIWENGQQELVMTSKQTLAQQFIQLVANQYYEKRKKFATHSP